MKNTYAFLLLTLAGSAQAITWAEYYAAHQAEVNAAVTTAPHHLDLANKGLTDLNGFDAIPGLNALQQLSLGNNQLRELSPTTFQGLNMLQELYLYNNQLRELPPTIFQGLDALQALSLDNNQLRELPSTIFQGLNALQWLYLSHNRIPGATARLRATLQLPNDVSLTFKTPDREHIEALFNAIGQSNIVTVRRLINDLASGRIRNPLDANILISSLRDYDGNNLLHAAIVSAARHLASIAGKSQNVQGTEKEKDAQRAKLAKDKSIINASYMKLINAILACGEQCAQEMLATPNAAGQNVVKAAIEKLGLHNSPITEALLKLGLPAVDVKTKLESYGSAATQRL